ncbi:MAG: metal-dependent transcriptional regulator [Nitrososphaerota archaeon]
MEDDIKISLRELDYLLAIFKKSRGSGYARNKHVVEELGVSKSTASLMIKKLRRIGLVCGSRKLKLTSVGEDILIEKFWKHGVIENALHRLGIPLDESCRLSWRIEPLLSRELVEHIWKTLNEPSRCPCGINLPDRRSSKSLREYNICRA